VLKNGGRLALADFHLVSEITEEKDGKATFRRSYFDQSPHITRPEPNVPPTVNFYWKLSDIVNAAIRGEFRIDYIEEFYVEEKAKTVPVRARGRQAKLGTILADLPSISFKNADQLVEEARRVKNRND
jgi:hypothetical protein